MAAASRSSGLLAGALAAVLTLVGCATPYEVPAPSPGPDAVAICDEVMSALPETVLDQTRGETTAPELTAVWGSPPISLRCGVDKPKQLGPGAECFEVNHVGWFAQTGRGGMVFTTIGRGIFIEVGVPAAYAPEANALVDLADAVSLVPVEQPCV